MLKETKSVSYVIRLTEKEHKALKKTAKSRNTKMSKIIRQALGLFFSTREID